jgi:hypothetical protein
VKINSDLGYKPVPFSELTSDPSFWSGCKTCTNYEILKAVNKMCLCTGMLFDQRQKKKNELKNIHLIKSIATFEIHQSKHYF